VVEVPPPKKNDKHPLLQKGVTIANYDASKGIFMSDNSSVSRDAK
jgi:hypothetical protein